MAGLKCNHCGFGMHHSQSCGIEYTVIPLDIWKQYLHLDLPIRQVASDEPNGYNTIWKCPVCNALHLSIRCNNRIKNVYIPTDLAALKNTTNPPPQGDKYAVFVDYLYEQISDDDVTHKQYEASSAYPIKLHASVTDTELIVYNDNTFTHPVRYYTCIKRYK